jgi:CRISPR system Cascade subunit CasD
MPEPILLLRLEGPLQSWGLRSRWSRRDTGPEPSKSAVIGLLGCAAGVSRPDWRSHAQPDRTLEEWDRSLCFGVRVDRPGVVETDYHTVQGRHWQADGNLKRTTTAETYSGGRWRFSTDIHTEVSWRDYLHDAAFVVALTVKQDHKGADPGLLARLEHGLSDPKWPPYLGRKACVPSRPILDRLTNQYEDLETALRLEPWAAPRLRAQWPSELEAWIESADGEYERQDAIRLNRLRFYGFRRCRRIIIEVSSLPRRIG